ncbi:MAG: Crp/Fnr family transcriptional regulator [Deltaproteobacteria bacterium]|nr:Crp/Fnr family transcriptional regulator [Deltaproteobacteria bacterium]
MFSIAELPFFKGLAAEYLEDLSKIAVEQTHGKGQTLFLEGSKATGFYVILSGRIKIYKLSLEGKEQILHIFGPEEFFGEVPVFAGGNYPAHATALESSRVLFFPRDAFVDLIRKESSLALNMLAILSKRLRRFTHLIEDLSLKEVPGRLAAYLLYLSEQNKRLDSFDLDITKTQLASLLGTIPETLSRILGKMSQMELIHVDGRRIKLLDRKALENLASGERLLA